MTTHSLTEALKTAISRTNGSAEISPCWVKDHLAALSEFDFVDVREPHELVGLLGAAYGVVNQPLKDFLDTAKSRQKERPVVIICRSGRRSALAADALEQAGFTAVASVEGGTLAWNHQVLGRDDVHVLERHRGAQSLKDAQYVTNGVGVPEVSVNWTHDNLGKFRLVDVRGPAELTRDGQILQAVNVPLGELGTAATEWKKDEPFVVMCRSGGRSARAAHTLINAGFTNVVSMEGGMMGWQAAGLPQA